MFNVEIDDYPFPKLLSNCNKTFSKWCPNLINDVYYFLFNSFHNIEFLTIRFKSSIDTQCMFCCRTYRFFYFFTFRICFIKLTLNICPYFTNIVCFMIFTLDLYYTCIVFINFVLSAESLKLFSSMVILESSILH